MNEPENLDFRPSPAGPAFFVGTRNKVLFAVGVLMIAGVLAAGGFWAGWAAGSGHPQVITISGIRNATSTVADMDAFWQTWQAIDENHLKAPGISAQDRVTGAIKGLVGSLKDPYSEYFTAPEARKFREDVRGNFGGIGAELGIRKDILTVIAPMKDTPAERAGLKAGDMILKIQATSTQDLSVDEAVSYIRGPVDSTVTLNVFRQGWEKPKDFTLTRAVIQIPTLDFSMKGDIAYVQLYSFNANAGPLFAAAVRKAQAQGAQGMVLDLRNNPGGYLDVAVDLAGWFLPENSLVVSEESRIAPKEEFRADGNAALADLPVAVLVNGGSASASEILAGALRDNRGIKLVGETSFGKGTVQDTFPMAGNASLKLTIAHWVLPSGKVLENGGLKPDVEVGLSDQDLENKKDPQLDKALEVVKGLIR